REVLGPVGPTVIGQVYQAAAEPVGGQGLGDAGPVSSLPEQPVAEHHHRATVAVLGGVQPGVYRTALSSADAAAGSGQGASDSCSREGRWDGPADPANHARSPCSASSAPTSVSMPTGAGIRHPSNIPVSMAAADA